MVYRISPVSCSKTGEIVVICFITLTGRCFFETNTIISASSINPSSNTFNSPTFILTHLSSKHGDGSPASLFSNRTYSSVHQIYFKLVVYKVVSHDSQPTSMKPMSYLNLLHLSHKQMMKQKNRPAAFKFSCMVTLFSTILLNGGEKNGRQKTCRIYWKCT